MERRFPLVMRMSGSRGLAPAAVPRISPPGRWWLRESVCGFCAVALVAACFLASCHHPPAKVTRAPDLSQLEMDPSKFTRLALRGDVEIKMEEVQAGRRAAPRTRWYVVGYREHENRKGFVPDRESEYTNLFLVSEVEWTGDHSGTVKGRYLVVESWHYYLAQGIKTCHQWVIRESNPQTAPSRASFHLLVEDFNNVFLGERHAPLDAHTLKRLEDFYLEVKPFLVEKAKHLSADSTDRV